MTKGEAWRNWWTETHGKHMPMGGYHPMEGAIYDAWSAGWDAADKQSQTEITYRAIYDAWSAGWEAADKQSQAEITHLKEQLMRANTNDGAYKAAFLAGQMTARGGSWK